jgi:2',3'-cyclic-nucleotide 2'-phosphodiesterase (5'-nucleotidase family)
MKLNRFLLNVLYLIVLAFIFSGCGKDESEPYDPSISNTNKTYIEGMAADGAPIKGSVFIRGTKKQSSETESENKEPEIVEVIALIDQNGQYKGNVTHIDPPYVILAKGKVNEKKVQYYSITNSNNWTNCTEYSDAALKMSLNGQSPEKAFAEKIQIPEDYEKSKTFVTNTVKKLLTTIDSASSDFDPFNDKFETTKNDPFDKLLRVSQIITTNDQLIITANQMADAPVLYTTNYKDADIPANVPDSFASEINNLSEIITDTIINLTILQTSDIHNHASGYGPLAEYTPMDTTDNDTVLGGLSRIASKVLEIKTRHAQLNNPLLLIDSGDYFMGTMYDLSAIAPVPLIFFQALGYDAITLGNHEFDWTPKGLAMLLNNGIEALRQQKMIPEKDNYSFKIVASNTIIPGNNELAAFKNNGVIVDYMVKTLTKGFKIGILGYMGQEADTYAPAAPPVTFDHDFTKLQNKVNLLKNEGCQLIVLLSHSGVDINGNGDDRTLAENVTGIDFIASGHAHTATEQPFKINNTYIFSPGAYGQYISRMAIRYDTEKKEIVETAFDLIKVDDSIQGYQAIDDTINLVNAGLSENLKSNLGVGVDDTVVLTDIDIEFSETAGPSGLGNLCTDAFRAVANVLALSEVKAKYQENYLSYYDPFRLSVIANGTLRDSIKSGNSQIVTFSDVFNVLPLGISPTGEMPGYPLISVYLNAADIRKLCELTVAVQQGGDPRLTSEYFLHFSGLQYDYDPELTIGTRVNKVRLYAIDDVTCTNTPHDELSDFNDSTTVYRAVVDLYLLQMMYVLSNNPTYDDFKPLLPGFRDKNGTLISLEPTLSSEAYPTFRDQYAIDTDPNQNGAQELLAWTALFKYMQAWKGNEAIEHRDGIPVVPSLSPYNTTYVAGLSRQNEYQPIAKLTILQTADLHNHVSGYGPFIDYTPMDTSDNDIVTGGFARLAGKIVEIKMNRFVSNIPMLLVDSGDFYMGTMYDLAVEAPVPLIFFQALGYDATTLGNHEFDWTPKGLALLINNGINAARTNKLIKSDELYSFKFIASNTNIPDGNDLSAFEANEVIVDKMIKSLPNGLKVGILGYMGIQADAYAPAAPPVTFDHDYQNLQNQVDALKNEGCHIVMILSHSGIDEDGNGDDRDLAEAVNGIDIIASGHAHTATFQPVQVNDTIIFSPGAYGQYLSRVDIEYDLENNTFVSKDFSLIEINDSIAGYKDIDDTIQLVNAELSSTLQEMLGVEVDAPVAVTDYEIEFSETIAKPSGLGHLTTDAFRGVANQLAAANPFNNTPYMMSIIANGNLRDTIKSGKTGEITFSDIYNVLPLGISPKTSRPGYPLISVYLNAADIRKLCEITIAVQEKSHPLLVPEYYLHFSGVKFQYNPAVDLGYRVNKVQLFDPTDVMCTNNPVLTLKNEYGPDSIWDSDSKKVYRAVVDLYLLQMFYVLKNDPKYTDFLDLLPEFRDQNGNPLPLEQSVSAEAYPTFSEQYAIDSDLLTEGVQELPAWTALLEYMKSWKTNESFEHRNNVPVIPIISPYNTPYIQAMPRQVKFAYDSTIANFTLLQTSDLHNHVSGYGPLAEYTPMDTSDQDTVKGGFARIASAIINLKIQQLVANTPLLLVDSGDYFMGTMYDLSAEAPVPLLFFQALGYDAVTIGNHEFDWSPTGLALLFNNGINAARANKLIRADELYSYKIVASNTIIPDDNALSLLLENDIIVHHMIQTLPNGLKIGMLGYMGQQADTYAPAAPPVTFDHDFQHLQNKVNALKDDGCDIIILLSHSGVEEDGTGDDDVLAKAVSGIDIIASGHAHTATDQPFVVNNTLIFSPGAYGQYLSRLDIQYNMITDTLETYDFELISIDDTIPGYKDINDLVTAVNVGLSDNLKSQLGVDVDDPVVLTDIDIEFSESAGPSGLGNLCTDAFRAVGNVLALAEAQAISPSNFLAFYDPFRLSIIANGTVRDSIKSGKTKIVTFSDIFNVLPLGISPAGSLPGYPLISIYLNAADIRKFCELSVAVQKGGDPRLTPEYYLHFSGIQYDYNKDSTIGTRVNKLRLYAIDDVTCTNTPQEELSDFSDDSKTVYRAVVDLYLLQMIYVLSNNSLYNDFQSLIPGIRDKNGNLIDLAPTLSAVAYKSFSDQYAIDIDPTTNGAQELPSWTALFKYMQAWQGNELFEHRDGIPVVPSLSPYNTTYVAGLSRQNEYKPIAQLTILQTSDLHNHASGYGPLSDYTPMDTTDNDIVTGGFARLAGKIAEIKLNNLIANIPLLLVDSGDYFMGTMYDLAADAPIPFIYFQALGYDAITLGNHEFDWSPKGLAMLIQNGIQNELMPFQIPIIASNTEIPGDNELYYFKHTGVIIDDLIKELPNGLKVGILGLMGRDADLYSPAAPPVTFNHTTDFLQGKVDALKNSGCDIVLVLSHGGVDSSGFGDDNILANNINGIDIIASGHAHTATHQAFTRGSNDTIIFSPGAYGEYISCLNITYNQNSNAIEDYNFELIKIDDTIVSNATMDDTIKQVDAALSEQLEPALGVKVDDTVAYTDIDVSFSESDAAPSGLGNLCTDSFRAVANVLAQTDPNGTTPYILSVVANGNIRDSIKPGNTGKITFSDLFNVLPLGMSPKAEMPGYPLISVYLNASDIRALCEISVAVQLSATQPNSSLHSSYYLHFSGVYYEYNPEATIGYRVNSVSFFNPIDAMCMGETIQTLPSEQIPDSIWDQTSKQLYRAVVDLYLLQMFYVISIDSNYKEFWPLLPEFKDSTGNPLSILQIFTDYETFSYNYGIDADPLQADVQELMAWTALFKYIQAWQGNQYIEKRDGYPVLPSDSPYNASKLNDYSRIKAVQ